MANLKMLKMPKAPRLGKKPAQSASLQTKQAWINRNNDARIKHEAKVKAIISENAKRKAINEASKKASTIIAGIGNILEVRPASFKVSNVRAPRKYGHAGGSKTTKSKAKPGAKKRPVKKAAKKTARRR